MTASDRATLVTNSIATKTERDTMEELYLKYLVLNTLPLEQTHDDYLKEIFKMKNISNFPPSRNTIKENFIPKYQTEAMAFIKKKISESNGT